MRVALHDELADLRDQVGPRVFDDPVAFRAAFDDFISEGAASTGEVSLLVGAIATGALQRLKDQLALGADPATSIAVQGDLLARDRGTSETDGARWALSVLAHASGSVPVDLVLTRPSVPDSLGTPGPAADSAPAPGIVDPGPTRAAAPPATAAVDATQVASQQPPPPPPPPGPTPAPPAGPSPAIADPGRGRALRTNPLLLGAVAVLAIVAVTAIVLLFLRDEDPGGEADDPSTAAGDGGSPAGQEEVLAEIELTDAGKTVQVQLVHEGTDASIVLLAEHDGDLTEVDRVPAGCPYLDASYDPMLRIETAFEIAWGWQNNGSTGFGSYGTVQVDEEMLISYRDEDDEDCPVAP